MNSSADLTTPPDCGKRALSGSLQTREDFRSTAEAGQWAPGGPEGGCVFGSMCMWTAHMFCVWMWKEKRDHEYHS